VAVFGDNNLRISINGCLDDHVVFGVFFDCFERALFAIDVFVYLKQPCRKGFAGALGFPKFRREMRETFVSRFCFPEPIQPRLGACFL
jgi:hypothetical protein